MFSRAELKDFCNENQFNVTCDDIESVLQILRMIDSGELDPEGSFVNGVLYIDAPDLIDSTAALICGVNADTNRGNLDKIEEDGFEIIPEEDSWEDASYVEIVTSRATLVIHLADRLSA